MKYASFLILLIIGLMAQGSRAPKITFKDQNLKQALLEQGYDRNKDGEIEVSEIDTVTKLEITNKKIKLLDDLVSFKNLKSLNINYNEVTNLDVFFNNAVIEEIYIGHNPIGKKLTLRNVKNLKIFIAFKNELEDIDLTGTNNIEQLYLQENRFEKVEFKNLPKLESLQLMDNKTLKSVEVSANRLLKNLYLTGTAITQLDVTNNPSLNILYVDDNVKLTKSKSQAKLKPAPMIRVEKQVNR
jgi:hypothetical protein